MRKKNLTKKLNNLNIHFKNLRIIISFADYEI